MSARSEQGGGAFEGIKLLLCENPLPPIDEGNGGSFDMDSLPALLRRHPNTFIGLAGRPIASWGSRYDNLLVTRTFAKAHRLAGFMIGYGWTRELAAARVQVGAKVFPSETYFFLPTPHRMMHRTSRSGSKSGTFSSSRLATLCSARATCGSPARFSKTTGDS